MFHQKTDNVRVPVAVSLFRVVHGLLILHAAAIVGISFMDVSAPGMTPERIFAMVVAISIGLGSFAFLLATTVRALFTLGIFICSFLGIALACLPLMATLFFPMHLVTFGFAAIYGISCFILVHFFFVQPVPKKK